MGAIVVTTFAFVYSSDPLIAITSMTLWIVIALWRKNNITWAWVAVSAGWMFFAVQGEFILDMSMMMHYIALTIAFVTSQSLWWAVSALFLLMAYLSGTYPTQMLGAVSLAIIYTEVWWEAFQLTHRIRRDYVALQGKRV